MTLQLSDKNIPSNKLIVSEKSIIRIAKLIAICLVCGFFINFFLHSRILQELAFIALIFPALLQIRYGLADIRRAHRHYMYALFYLIPVLLSFFINHLNSGITNIFDIIVIINLYFGFYIAAIFSSCSKHDLLKYILKYVFLFSLPLFLYVSISQREAYIWGRWHPFDIQPNWWGMMTLGSVWGAMALKSMKLRIAAITAAFIFMVQLQSRGSIVALMPVLLFSSGLFLPIQSRKLFYLFIALLVLLVGVTASEIILERGILERLIDYIFNQVLLLNDSRRGVGTGLTGRTEGYLLAWEGFLKSPVLGNGIGEYDFVHNGFLLIMAETGLLGLIGALIIIGRSFFSIVKKRNWTYFGLLISYIAALMTFPRSFNINMTGFIFIILVMNNYTTNNKL